MTSTSSTPTRAAPVAAIREAGIRIPIWINDSGEELYYTAGRPELSYRDEAGVWHGSHSYRDFELECLSLAALAARKKLRQLRAEAKGHDDADEHEQP